MSGVRHGNRSSLMLVYMFFWVTYYGALKSFYVPCKVNRVDLLRSRACVAHKERLNSTCGGSSPLRVHASVPQQGREQCTLSCPSVVLLDGKCLNCSPSNGLLFLEKTNHNGLTPM